MSKDDHIVGGKSGDRFSSKLSNLGVEDDPVKLKDIFITIHKPKYVIRLETERFRTCLGYLVFPKIDVMMAQMGSTAMGANAVDGLCAKILSQIQKSLMLNKTNDKVSIAPELKEIVAGHLKSIQKGDDLQVRYVPPEMMVHWRINNDRFYPYGESILEVVNFDARLLIALKTATTIKRLTSATDKRFISVETGLPRDAKNLVEMIKEGMRKRKISVDSFGSIDTIPSQIATFEDIYIPMRDGKKYVEFDHGQWGQSAQEDIEPLKFMRDNIVANLGVPAPFLGLEENTSNRALLTVENIVFCRTIISFQKELSVPLRELFEKIYILLYPRKLEEMDDVKITFPEPKVSPYEHEMEYVEQMQRLIESYTALDIPKTYLKRKYLPALDWDEIEAYNAEEKVKKELGEETGGEDDSMGGMGGMGSMGGGF